MVGFELELATVLVVIFMPPLGHCPGRDGGGPAFRLVYQLPISGSNSGSLARPLGGSSTGTVQV